MRDDLLSHLEVKNKWETGVLVVPVRGMPGAIDSGWEPSIHRLKETYQCLGEISTLGQMLSLAKVVTGPHLNP